MSRLAPLDKALVLILVPIWVVCFALGVRTQLRGGGIPALELSVAGGDDYPALTGDFSPLAASDPLAESGLRAGDRLVRVGDADLRGVALLGFNARVLDQAGSDLRVPLVFERDGQQLETSLTLTPVSVLGPPLACSVPVVLSALFLLLRSRPTPMVRAYFYAAMAGAFCITIYLGSAVEAYASTVTAAAGMSVFFPLLFHFLFLYPDGRPPKGRWHRIFPWFFALLHSGGYVGGFISRIAIGTQETLGWAGEPGVRALGLDGGDDAVQHALIAQGLVGLLVDEHGDRHAPGALAGDAPVGPVLDHGFDALAPRGRYPARL